MSRDQLLLCIYIQFLKKVFLVPESQNCTSEVTWTIPDSGVMEVVRAEAKESFLELSFRGVMSGVLKGVVAWEGVLTNESVFSTSNVRSNFDGISRFVESSGEMLFVCLFVCLLFVCLFLSLSFTCLFVGSFVSL